MHEESNHLFLVYKQPFDDGDFNVRSRVAQNFKVSVQKQVQVALRATKKRDITSKYIESWWCEKIIYWAVEIAWNAGDDP